MVFIFNLILNIFFFRFLGQKSKHKMGKCKQKLEPLFVWDPLYDGKAKGTLQGL